MHRMVHVLLAACLLLSASSVLAADSVVPGTISTETTTQNIAVRWQIVGDDDLDASCTVRYRVQGSAIWLDALDLFRASPTHTLGENRLAGSIFFLQPDTSYELELSLSDPDGGGDQQVVLVSTETELGLPASPTDYWVVPGSGGGTGSQLDPFQGLQEAADSAHPGAAFHLAAGVYAPFTLTTSGSPGNPIVFRGPVDAMLDPNESNWAIVDGAGTTGAIVNIGISLPPTPTSHLIFENLVLQNASNGVVARHTQYLLFRRNLVREVDMGFFNNRSEGLERRQVLADNTFVGPGAWPFDGTNNSTAIYLRGTANEVVHNKITQYDQGIVLFSAQEWTGGSDVYGNDIAYVGFDALDIQEFETNTRLWRNRAYNVGSAVALGAVHGGPVYVFRNEVFNLSYSALKMNTSPSGMVVIHNTVHKLGSGVQSLAGWENSTFRNNMILGSTYAVEFVEFPVGMHDWDYDALGSVRGAPVIKWQDRYNDVAEFTLNTGLEVHGLDAVPGDLVDATLPLAYEDGVLPGSRDLRLVALAPEINAGLDLPNINGPFVSDGLPDCGAFEFGSDLPDYGPRPPVSTAVREIPRDARVRTVLYPAQPNPFNPATMIRFELPRAAFVELSIYDATGRRVRSLLSSRVESGMHAMRWDGKDDSGEELATGVYFVKLQWDGEVESGKLALVR